MTLESRRRRFRIGSARFLGSEGREWGEGQVMGRNAGGSFGEPPAGPRCQAKFYPTSLRDHSTQAPAGYSDLCRALSLGLVRQGRNNAEQKSGQIMLHVIGTRGKNVYNTGLFAGGTGCSQESVAMPGFTAQEHRARTHHFAFPLGREEERCRLAVVRCKATTRPIGPTGGGE